MKPLMSQVTWSRVSGTGRVKLKFSARTAYSVSRADNPYATNISQKSTLRKFARKRRFFASLSTEEIICEYPPMLSS